jgi:AcrR family transcriptional regulator
MAVQPAKKPYHHGDLRRALLEAAADAIAEVGPAGVSLRDLARRVGVSHAAPAHHFGDKTGLLTAVAADGYRLLDAAMRQAWEETHNFLEVGVAYVRFAVTHRAHFEVMFRPELYRADDPELRLVQTESARLLYGPLTEMGATTPVEAGVAAWSLMHGVAWLWLNGILPAEVGDDPEAIARTAGRYLFQASRRQGERKP